MSFWRNREKVLWKAALFLLVMAVPAFAAHITRTHTAAFPTRSIIFVRKSCPGARIPEPTPHVGSFDLHSPPVEQRPDEHKQAGQRQVNERR